MKPWTSKRPTPAEQEQARHEAPAIPPEVYEATYIAAYNAGLDAAAQELQKSARMRFNAIRKPERNAR